MYIIYLEVNFTMIIEIQIVIPYDYPEGWAEGKFNNTITYIGENSNGNEHARSRN